MDGFGKRSLPIAIALVAAASLLVSTAGASAKVRTYVFKPRAVTHSAAFFKVARVSGERVLGAQLASRGERKRLNPAVVQSAARRGLVRVALHGATATPVGFHVLKRRAKSRGGRGGQRPRLVISVGDQTGGTDSPQPSTGDPQPSSPTPPDESSPGTSTPTDPSSPGSDPAPAPEPESAPEPPGDQPAPEPEGAPEPSAPEAGQPGTADGACALTSFAAGTVPGACWRPFSSDSPFNQPLPSSPRLMEGSGAIVEKMLSLVGGHGPTELEVFKDGRGGEPTYYSKPGDPTFTIHCTRSWGRCMLEGMKVRIPAGAETEGNSVSIENEGHDSHLTVVDPESGREYDFWQVQTNPIPAQGGTLNISWGGYTSVTGTGLHMTSEATAARWASLSGRIRAEEMLAGRINHAIFINVKCDSGSWVYPAAKAGAKCSDGTNAPPMGARLQLNYSVAEINAMAIPAWKKTVLRAMSEYGMFIGDTGSPGLFSLERETGLQYTSVGKANKWLELVAGGGFGYWSGEGGVYIGDVAGGIDWRRLRVIAPCVSEGTC